MVKKYEKFTCFVFTLPRPTPERIALLDNIPHLNICFYGNEVGPVSGTPHLQGYFEVKPLHPINLFKIISILKGYFVEPAKESRLHNYIYCSKDQKLVWNHGRDLPLDKDIFV